MDGSKPRQINFRMPIADAMRLDMLAQSEGLTTPDYVKRLVYAAVFPGEPVRSRTVVVDIDRGPKPPANTHVAARMTKERRKTEPPPRAIKPGVNTARKNGCDHPKDKRQSLGYMTRCGECGARL